MGCSVLNCPSKHRECRFYRFPADLNRMKHWASRCGRNNWIPTKTDFICEVSISYIISLSKIILKKKNNCSSSIFRLNVMKTLSMLHVEF